MNGQLLREVAFPKQVVHRWGDLDVSTAAARCAETLLPGALMLPFTEFTGRMVFPVVVLPEALVRQRLERHPEPICDSDTVGRFVDTPQAEDPVSPLRLAGTISVDTAARALPALAGLRVLGRAIHLRPAVAADADDLRAFELQGITVADATADPLVVVPGHSTKAPGSRYDPFWQRVREEELWSLALRSGVVEELVQH